MLLGEARSRDSDNEPLPGRRVLFCESSLPVTLEPLAQRSSLSLLLEGMFLPRRWSTS
jgi:hypothetical protein